MVKDCYGLRFRVWGDVKGEVDVMKAQAEEVVAVAGSLWADVVMGRRCNTKRSGWRVQSLSDGLTVNDG